MRMAIERPGLGAAVAYYGRHPDPETAAAIRSPLMLHHGELDERVNASWPAFEKGLADAGVNYTAYMYEEASHGFHNDTTPRYDADAAALSWQRSLDFFARHLEKGV